LDVLAGPPGPLPGRKANGRQTAPSQLQSEPEVSWMRASAKKCGQLAVLPVAGLARPRIRIRI